MKVELLAPFPPPDVQITMTQDEAASLYAVLRRVGGPPQGRRGHIEKIVNSFHDLKIPHLDGLLEIGHMDCIYFK